jgi:hypothetical protein
LSHEHSSRGGKSEREWQQSMNIKRRKEGGA